MQKALKWAGIGIGVLFVASLLFSEDEKPKGLAGATVGERIRSISEHVADVSEPAKGEALSVSFFKPDIWDGKNWVWNLLETEKAVLTRFSEAAQGAPYKRVTFMAYIPTRDNLGNEGRQLAIQASYTLGKLAGAKWDKMTEFDVAELADDLAFNKLGKQAALEFCADGNAKHTPKFCGMALR